MAFCEFFVTKGSSASNLNGGGPNLGTNDAATVINSNCSASADGLTIRNDAGHGWGTAATDDFFCWDTAGVKEIRRIVAVGLAGDEDFTTYTEVDSLSHLTVTASTISFANLTQNEEAYVYKDKGAAYFGTVFEWRVDVQATDHSAAGSQAVIWAVSDIVGSGSYWWNNSLGAVGVAIEYDSIVPEWHFKIYGFATQVIDTSLAVSEDTPYYLTIRRTSDIGIECRIYSDSGRTTLFDTISITILGGTFRYLFGINSFDFNVDETVGGSVANLEEYKEIQANAAVTVVSAKSVNVGGAWATVDFAASTITTAFVNAAGDPPRGNVKYSATDYDETVTIDNAGTLAIPITYEGYEDTPGDGCPNGNYPRIDGTGINANVITNIKTYITLRNFSLLTTYATRPALWASADTYCRYENIKASASGAGVSYALIVGLQSQIINAWVMLTAGGGISIGTQSIAQGCRVDGAVGYGIAAPTAAQPCSIIDCVINGPSDDCISFAGDCAVCTGNSCYGSTGGSGIRFMDFVGEGQGVCEDNILESNNQYGIEVDTEDKYLLAEDYNAFYGNGVNEVLNVLPTSGAGAHTGLHSLTNTASAFTTPGSDFSLNNTAGGGAAVRGLQHKWIDATHISYPDLGALQVQPSAGGGSTGGSIFHSPIIRPVEVAA